ncbi:hypothetical protein A6U98_13810 [Rhizobium sp. WYCCWR10014]|nr:hypothetical protein A6U98_13810 [Rhizobium sp. WYCCWR10014]
MNDDNDNCFPFAERTRIRATFNVAALIVVWVILAAALLRIRAQRPFDCRENLRSRPDLQGALRHLAMD